MATEIKPRTPTNGEVAARLGISNSMVSRLRSGSRNPSIHLMTKIKDKTGWKLEAQSKVFGTLAWAAGFEKAIRDGAGETRAGR